MEASKRDWKKIVSESKGTRFFLPDSFKERADDFNKQRIELNIDLSVAAEKEITMNMLSQNVLFEVRKYLAKNGFDEIWMKEIGWDADALKEGVFVINIMEPMK